MYYPDRWLIIKINEDIYKVFATWFGSYLQSDSWKMNSGIIKLEEDEKFYNFYGYSGSVYSCRKTSYGSTSFGYDVLSHFKAKINESEITDKLEVLDDQNWIKFFKHKL